MHPPKEIFHPANIESRDRLGFIQLSHSVLTPLCSGSQAKSLKGVEENQAERDIFWTTVVPTFGRFGREQETQSTVEEKLWSRA